MKNKKGQIQPQTGSTIQAAPQQPVKKSKLWLWILIAIVVIAIGIGIYFLLASGNGSQVVGGGNSIPQPPSLPAE